MEFKYPSLKLPVHIVPFFAILITHAQSSKYNSMTRTSLAIANTPSQVSDLQKYNFSNKREIHDQINLAGLFPLGLKPLGGSDGPKSKSITYIIVLSVIASILMPVTIVGNLLAIIAVCKEIKKGKIHNVFILSQAVGDFYIGMFVEPFYLYASINITWELGTVMCNIYLLGDWVVILATQSTIFVITADVYFKVTAPIRYRNWRTDRKINYIILSTWIVPCVIFVPTFLLLEPAGYVHVDTICEVPIMTDMWFAFILLIVQYWIPTIVKSFFYWKIYKTSIRIVKGGRQNYANQPSTHPPTNVSLNNIQEDAEVISLRLAKITDKIDSYSTSVDKQTPATSLEHTTGVANDPRDTCFSPIPSNTMSTAALERKIMVTIGLVVAVFVMLNSPFAVLLALPPFCGSKCRHALLFEIFFGLVYINSAINPFLYARANKSLWESMKRIAKCKC